MTKAKTDSVATQQSTKENIELTNSKIDTLKKDQLIEGQVVEIGKNAIFVDLGSLGIGIIFGREIKESRPVFKDLKPGDSISAVVSEPENEQGFVELSVKKAFREQTWGEIKESKKNKDIVSARVTAANRGGLIINYKGISGFLPVSQLSTENYPRVEEGDKNKILSHLNKFVNKEMAVRILDADPDEEKLIFSEKATEEKKIQEVLSQYEIGDVVEGEISGVVDFGAFIKFEAQGKNDRTETLEGLIHISELDWQLIQDPRDVINVGDKVKAKIIGIENNRLSLSIKALKKDPWDNIDKKYPEGKAVKGEVVKFNPFGAFVKLDKEIQGLVHISEFDNDQDKMKEELEIGKKHSFKVANIDSNSHKMALVLAKKSKKETEKK